MANLLNRLSAKKNALPPFSILCVSAIFQYSAHAEITIFAASSMTDVMTELAKKYEAAGGEKVRFNFASSGALARQIDAGAPADLFISANTKWVDWLEQESSVELVDRLDVAENRLALIAPRNSNLTFSREIAGRIAVGDFKSVPAGMYAEQALNNLGWLKKWQKQLVMSSNVRTALRYVERGEVAAGIVYASDARSSDAVEIVGLFPSSSHDAIVYPAARMSDREVVKEFLLFLKSAKAKAAFAQFGFSSIDDLSDLSNPDQSDVNVWSPVLLSLKVALGATVASLIPALFLGWLLARRNFPGKLVVESFIHAPMVIPPVVTGYLLLIILGKNGALGKALHSLFGIEFVFTWQGAALASAIIALPLAVRSIRIAIDQVDRRMEEAAQTLGYSPLKIFSLITIPLAWPGILGGVLLSFSRMLGEFGATITFAGNVEGSTQTLPLAIYSSLQLPGGEAGAMRLVAASLTLCVVSLVLSEWLARKSTRRVVA